MKNVLVSIIMPVYNNEKYLSGAIESVLNQTHKNIELLILDDGSTDSSLSIIENYAMHNKNIRLVSRDNKGVANSIDELLKYVKGDYIARMDGDDYSFPDRIEKQLKYLKENSDVGLVGSFVEVELTDYKNKDDVKLCEDIFNFKIDDKNPSIKFLNGHRICHGTFMCRAKIFEEVKYNINLNSSEDLDFIFNLISKNFKVGIIEKRFYLNRVDSEFVHRQKYLNEKYNEEILKSKLKFLQSYIKNREVCIVGKSKYSNTLYKILKNNNIKIGDSIIYEYTNDKFADLGKSYIFIVDKCNYEHIRDSLITQGKNDLYDFIFI